jgi:hypothetical protein
VQGEQAVQAATGQSALAELDGTLGWLLGAKLRVEVLVEVLVWGKAELENARDRDTLLEVRGNRGEHRGFPPWSGTAGCTSTVVVPASSDPMRWPFRRFAGCN